MGRLILAILSIAASGFAMAEGVPQTIPQQQMDSIREYHTKAILGSSQDLTNLQPDVVLYRNMFKLKNQKVEPQRHESLDPVPMAQVFKARDLTLGQLAKVSAAASGYDLVLDPQINQQQLVKFNSQPNSLTDIAEYLTRVTNAQFTVYQESRVMIGLKKGPTQ